MGLHSSVGMAQGKTLPFFLCCGVPYSKFYKFHQLTNTYCTWTKIVVELLLSINLPWFLPCRTLLLFYHSYMVPTFDYSNVVWHNCIKSDESDTLERLQNYAAQVNLRQQHQTCHCWGLQVPLPINNFGKSAFSFRGSSLWNILPAEPHTAPSLWSFSSLIKPFLWPLHVLLVYSIIWMCY